MSHAGIAIYFITAAIFVAVIFGNMGKSNEQSRATEVRHRRVSAGDGISEH